MNKPTLVLLHGLLNDERVWEPVAARLRARADIVVPDLRRQDSMAQMSRDAWAELAGFSMSGYAALIPGARLHIVEDAGHWAPLEQPAVVAEQLGALLDRV